MPPKKRQRPSDLAANRPLDTANLPDWVDHPDRVTDADINQLEHMVGTVREMNKRHGEGNWGREQIAAWIVETRKARIAATWLNHEERQVAEQAHAKLVDERVKEYLKQFTNVTPNDMIHITEMARIELALTMVDNKLRLLGEKSAADVSSSDIGTLVGVKKTLIASLQSIESALGIGLANREQESDIVVVYDKVKAKARELIAKRARQIVCSYCGMTGIVINLGHILFHMDFNDVPFRFQAQCPRCQKVFTIANHPILLEKALLDANPTEH